MVDYEKIERIQIHGSKVFVNTSAQGLYYNSLAGFTGVKEHSYKNNIIVYPNPFSDMLYVNNLDNIYKFEIYSVTGGLVYTQEVHSNSESINISDISSGIYIIRFYGLNTVFSVKVIKQ
jgi:hypothetical protein